MAFKSSYVGGIFDCASVVIFTPYDTYMNNETLNI